MKELGDVLLEHGKGKLLWVNFVSVLGWTYFKRFLTAREYGKETNVTLKYWKLEIERQKDFYDSKSSELCL